MLCIRLEQFRRDAAKQEHPHSWHWCTSTPSSFLLSAGESPSEAAEGNSPQDIIFLVDNTAGVEQPEFNNLLGFLQRYASSLAGQGYLGRDQTRMGVVTWGQSGLPFRAQFPLDMHFTNDTLQAAIAAIPFETGGIGVDDLAMTLEFLVDAFSGDFGARSYADHTAVLLLDAIGTGDIRIPASRVKDANIILYVIGVHEGTPSQTLMELVSTLEQFGTVAPNTGIQSTDLATFATVNSDPFVAALVTHLRTWCELPQTLYNTTYGTVPYVASNRAAGDTTAIWQLVLNNYIHSYIPTVPSYHCTLPDNITDGVTCCSLPP